MQTIIIWDTIGMSPIQFFVLDGDYRQLSNIYINAGDNQVLEDKLYDLIYDGDGLYVQTPLKNFPSDVFNQTNTVVIVAGFLP